MIRLRYLLLALLAAWLLAGCYESDVPLSAEPAEPVDTRLIKSWQSIPQTEGQKALLLVVRKFNTREYLVAWKGGDDSTAILARGFVTKIKEIRIMNLQGNQSLKKSDRTFVFFKYDFNNEGHLLAAILSQDHPAIKDKKFKTAAAFYDFMQKNITQKGLFKDPIEFIPSNKINFDLKR